MSNEASWPDTSSCAYQRVKARANHSECVTMEPCGDRWYTAIYAVCEQCMSPGYTNNRTLLDIMLMNYRDPVLDRSWVHTLCTSHEADLAAALLGDWR